MTYLLLCVLCGIWFCLGAFAMWAWREIRDDEEDR